MKVYLKMIQQMVMAFTSILMELSIKDNGKKISNMEKALKHGQMELIMKAAT